MVSNTQTYKWVGLDGRLSPAASLLRAPYGANNNNHHIYIYLTNNKIIFISFVVRPNQLESGGSVRLKCTASVLDLYWRSSEVNALQFNQMIG